MPNNSGQMRAWLPVLKDSPVGAFGMFYLAVDDFHAYVEQIRPLVDVTKEVAHEGMEILYFTDPDGYVMGVTQKREW